MPIMRASQFVRRDRRWIRAAVVLCFGLSACDGILDVDLPGDITEGDLLRPGMAETMVLSGISQFECSFSTFTAADGDANADAWHRTVGWWGGSAEYRQRPNTTQCATAENAYGWYVPLQMARFQLEQAYTAFEGWTPEQVPDRDRLMAMAATYIGLSYQMLGEHFCEVTVDVGPLMTPRETLGVGERWFDRALQHAGTRDFSFAGTQSIRQLAHLGRARVRFANGDLQGAREDALLVQPDFIAYATREETEQKRWNQVYANHNINGWFTVAGVVQHEGRAVPFTGYRNLTIDAQGRSTIGGYPVIGEGTPDPRVPVRQRSTQTVGGPLSESFEQTKYMARGADQILGKWAEAQLILAEIEGGQQAVARINALRDRHGLPHFSSSDPEEIRLTIIEERRREFYLEGRFWADKIRYDLWFPRGVGLTPIVPRAWGPATCVLMPESEYTLNPHLQ